MRIMTDSREKQISAIDTFRSLHTSGCFVLPNPWDVGSAVYLEHLGFRALATTSAGFAFSQGLPDGVSAVSLEATLRHFREVVQATSLPVNADFQNCYADQPDDVEKNVRLCVATGVAGLSIEDSTGNNQTPLYERELAIERVRAARTAIDKSGLPVVLTARCEAWLVRHPEVPSIALDRLAAYADAGADCLYAPGVGEAEDIAAIVKAVAPKPVNVLVSSPGHDLTMERLTKLGVRRVSVGGALARVAWAAFMRAARGLASGSFEGLTDAASSAELNQIFSRRQ